MNWKIAIIALFLPLVASAADTESKQDIAKGPSTLSGTTVNSYAKPGAPVELSYTVPKNLGTGNTGVIKLAFNTQANEGDLKVHIESDHALIISDLTSSDFNIALGADTKTYPVSISVTSTVEGLFYVNVFASMDVGGNTLTRTFSVPVKVGTGSPQLKSSGALEKDENGNPVIILPAIESIK